MMPDEMPETEVSRWRHDEEKQGRKQPKKGMAEH